MLRRFEVKNFKCFKENFVLDLTDTKNYAFNEECVQDGIAAKAMIYGPNGCGKSNLALAIFDIKNHLTDGKVREQYQHNYLNVRSDSNIAEFAFTFRFGDMDVVYQYGKISSSNLVYEFVEINKQLVVSIDRRLNNILKTNLEGTENLHRDLTGMNFSAVKYIYNNSILADNTVCNVFGQMMLFVQLMNFTQTTESSGHLSPSDEIAISKIIISDKYLGGLKGFEKFLNDFGVKCQLSSIILNGNQKIAFDFGVEKVDFFKIASSGTLSASNVYVGFLYLLLSNESHTRMNLKAVPCLIIDEFDAYYHHKASRQIVKKLKEANCQIILTTHNTSIMSNDLLRPDCYFIMDNETVKPMHSFTDKELRKAHNIEKMYKAGAFSE
jgi:AAA15 family ATPase/GTPase